MAHSVRIQHRLESECDYKMELHGNLFKSKHSLDCIYVAYPLLQVERIDVKLISKYLEVVMLK